MEKDSVFVVFSSLARSCALLAAGARHARNPVNTDTERRSRLFAGLRSRSDFASDAQRKVEQKTHARPSEKPTRKGKDFRWCLTGSVLASGRNWFF